MDTLEYDYTLHTTDKGDKSLHVTFYMHFIKDEKRSEEEGHPIFQDVPWIRIYMPGDRTNIIDRPTRPGDQFRFPEQWARFKNSQEQRAEGTPVEEWPIVTRGQAEELRYLGFTTVEQIATASDNVNYMGIGILKEKAKVYLETARGNTAPTERLIKDNEELKAQVKVLTEAVNEMRAGKKAKEPA